MEFNMLDLKFQYNIQIAVYNLWFLKKSRQDLTQWALPEISIGCVTPALLDSRFTTAAPLNALPMNPTGA